jgi:hypothetical protein
MERGRNVMIAAEVVKVRRAESVSRRQVAVEQQPWSEAIQYHKA